MNALNFTILLVAAYIVVFCEASITWVRDLFGAQVDLLPALVTYAAFSGNVTIIATVSLCGGLWFDSLSANPLGISVLPLFAIGLLVHYRREIILREEAYAQFWVGFAASIMAPLIALLLLLSLGRTPLVGWGSLWQLFVMGVGGGAMTPVFFWLFQWLDRTLSYQPLPETSFRSDREIKRGRR